MNFAKFLRTLPVASLTYVRSLIFIYIFLEQSSQRQVRIIIKAPYIIAYSNFFRFHTMNYFTYLLPQRYHATEMILRATLIKHCKQSMDGFLENNDRINMLFALIAFLNLWLKNLKNANFGRVVELGSA